MQSAEAGGKVNNSFFYLLFLIFGYTVTSTQILFLRTFLAVFSGNELSVGIFFSAWLFWTAVGSLFWGKIVRKRRNATKLLFILQTVLTFFILLTVLAIRISRLLLYPYPGEIAGFGAIVFSSLVILLPYCFISGGLFAVGSFLLHLKKRETLAGSTAKVYMLETAGSALGGIAFSLLLLSVFNALDIACFLFLINILISLYLIWRLLKWPLVSRLFFLLFTLVFIAGIFWTNKTININEWPGFKILAEKDSEYGHYTLIGRHENHTILENNLPLFTIPDLQTAEENVHYALLLHNKPVSVLLIGGGLGGAINEILKYSSVKILDYVEIDPALIRLVQKHFHHSWEMVHRDKRVHIYNSDGRLFLQKSKKKYDVIILNLPDPFTAQINRFYTEEFFSLCAGKLNSRGILSFQVSGAENYLNKPLARYLSCLYVTLKRVFPSVAAMPGETIHFFASKRQGGLSLNADLLIKRLKAHQIKTKYVREYFLPFKISAERLTYLQRVLTQTGPVQINKDFSPRAYYLTSVFWSSHFSALFPRFLWQVQSVKFYWLIAGLFFILIIIIIMQQTRSSFKRAKRFYAAQTVFASGFTMMSLELLIFMAYQALHGSLYYNLAILLGIFMAGMSFGTWLSLRIKKRQRPSLLAVANLWLAFITIIAGFFIYYGLNISAALSRFLFNLIIGFVGMSGGFVFPLVSSFYYENKDKKNSGSVYGFDLTGSLIGSFFTTAFIIPVYGFKEIIFLIILIHLITAFGIFILLFLEKRLAWSEVKK